MYYRLYPINWVGLLLSYQLYTIISDSVKNNINKRHSGRRSFHITSLFNLLDIYNIL
jgi:hypothetical protein